MTVTGNIKGIPRHILEELDTLNNLQIDKSLIIDSALAGMLCAATSRLNREIAVYIDRRGRVNKVSIGNDDSVGLSETASRRSKSRPCGLRCIHTHPRGSGMLSDLDITAAANLNLDCMLALGVAEDGTAGSAGLIWAGESSPQLYNIFNEVLEIDFSAFIRETEKNIAKIEDEQAQAESAILVALSCGREQTEVDNSLAELKRLAETAGISVLSTLTQSKDRPSSSTYIGKGKVEELQFMAQTLSADIIIFDDEISPTQLRVLEDLTGKRIIDRSMLILDIFASRAISNEGKLQVELAQLKYMMPRLTGRGIELSRLGGGIGTRGPGETKLETDRRKIRVRIKDLERRLDEVLRTRKLHREKRNAESLPTVAMVGYTNAGKSSLLNLLSDETTFTADLLFATLDTLTRRVNLPSGKTILLSDTVGFIRRLPHHLIAAFRATLEEVTQADLLLHVIDGSCAEAAEQAEAVIKVLSELKATDKKIITVINKSDLAENINELKRLSSSYTDSVIISVKNSNGIEELFAKIEELLPQKLREISLTLPFSAGSLLSYIHDNGRVLAQEYTDMGITLKIQADEHLLGRLAQEGYHDL